MVWCVVCGHAVLRFSRAENIVYLRLEKYIRSRCAKRARTHMYVCTLCLLGGWWVRLRLYNPE